MVNTKIFNSIYCIFIVRFIKIIGVLKLAFIISIFSALDNVSLHQTLSLRYLLKLSCASFPIPSNDSQTYFSNLGSIVLSPFPVPLMLYSKPSLLTLFPPTFFTKKCYFSKSFVAHSVINP